MPEPGEQRRRPVVGARRVDDETDDVSNGGAPTVARRRARSGEKDCFLKVRDFPILQSLTDTERHDVQGQVSAEVIPRGRVIYTAREPADRVFLLGSGIVKLTRALDGRRSLTLGLLRAGDVFGGLGVAEGDRFANTAIAMHDALCYTLERAFFESILLRRPRLAIEVGKVLANQYRRAVSLGMELAGKSVAARLGKVLVELSGDFRRFEPAGARIGIRVTQTDLAEMIGSTRETTSKLINEFRRQGWVDASKGMLHVVDEDALRRLSRNRNTSAA